MRPDIKMPGVSRRHGDERRIREAEARNRINLNEQENKTIGPLVVYPCSVGYLPCQNSAAYSNVYQLRS